MSASAGRGAFHAAVLDALQEQIAVMDRRGFIRYVNRAWIAFGCENGASLRQDWSDASYMSVFLTDAARGDVYAVGAEKGMRDVLQGITSAFTFEYPCHGPNEKRWFVMRVAALAPPNEHLLVVSHHDITPQKLAEQWLENLSRHDALTGLPNRRHMDLFLLEEWKRCMRLQLPLAVVMADIDHFKDYNDHLGHLAGDQCLRRVGGVLHTFARRPGDLVARFGGEEFVMILGNTSLDQAAAIAEEVRGKVLGLNIRHGSGRRLSVSLGVAATVPVGEQAEGLLRSADEALYHAKAGGRNRVARASDS